MFGRYHLFFFFNLLNYCDEFSNLAHQDQLAVAPAEICGVPEVYLVIGTDKKQLLRLPLQDHDLKCVNFASPYAFSLSNKNLIVWLLSK